MMAPKYLQAVLLKHAVDDAVEFLSDMIEKVEVVGNRVWPAPGLDDTRLS
jgi:hypothetical protein